MGFWLRMYIKNCQNTPRHMERPPTGRKILGKAEYGVK